MTDGSPIVEITDVRYAYPDGTVALDGVSVRIAGGSIVAVVGQNGSGKTTLAKHLNGLLRPSSGRVVVDGLDTLEHPVRTLAGHVGYVFQNPGHQLFARTVADELAFGTGSRREEHDERGGGRSSKGRAYGEGVLSS